MSSDLVDVPPKKASADARDPDLAKTEGLEPIQPNVQDPDHLVGQSVSRYVIIDKLGGGGMGVVYRAEDRQLERIVALKFLSPRLSTNANTLARFLSEARAASALDHPNICTVFEVGETDDGHHFIAMAYYHGETLEEKNRAGAGAGRSGTGLCRATGVGPREGARARDHPSRH